jgi:hypothetical protein
MERYGVGSRPDTTTAGSAASPTSRGYRPLETGSPSLYWRGRRERDAVSRN